MVHRTIWKFPLRLYGDDGMATDHPVVDIPADAELLHLGLQNNHPTLWALVDPSHPVEQRGFVVVGTGQILPTDAGDYIGTWQSAVYVFHLFETDG